MSLKSHLNNKPISALRAQDFTFNADDALDLFKVEPQHPNNAFLTLTSTCGKSQIIYVGALFQFTQRDQEAWNNLILHSELPEPSMGLGAIWARATEYHPADFYKEHMPKGKFKIQSKEDTFGNTSLDPHTRNYDGYDGGPTPPRAS